MDNCPMCGNNHSELLYKKKYCSPYIYSGQDITLLFKICPDCGFIYLANPIDSDELKIFYENIGHIQNLNGDENKQVINRQKDFIYSAVSDNINNILDVGCSDFSFLRLFHNRLRKYGIDVRKQTEQMKNHSIRYYSTCFETFEPETRFGLICMRHVLEHFTDINLVFRKLGQLLKKDGYLYIEVPDIYYYPNAKASNCGFYFEHVSYFSVISLTNLLRKYGYKLLNIAQEVNPRGSVQSYGVIRVLAQNSGNGRLERFQPMNDSFLSKRVIEIYLDNVQKRNTRITSELINTIDQSKVAIFGAGANTVEIMNCLDESKRKKIVIYIDNDSKKIGRMFFGKKIISLVDIAKFDIDTIAILAYSFGKTIYKQIDKVHKGKYTILTPCN